MYGEDVEEIFQIIGTDLTVIDVRFLINVQGGRENQTMSNVGLVEDAYLDGYPFEW